MKHEKAILSITLIVFLVAIVYFIPYLGARQDGPVYNDPWTGSVRQAPEYLAANLKDPSSLEIIEWGKVKKAGAGYSVSCTFRARNSFGGYNVQTEVFLFNKDGYLISTAPLN